MLLDDSARQSTGPWRPDSRPRHPSRRLEQPRLLPVTPHARASAELAHSGTLHVRVGRSHLSWLLFLRCRCRTDSRETASTNARGHTRRRLVPTLEATTTDSPRRSCKHRARGGGRHPEQRKAVDRVRAPTSAHERHGCRIRSVDEATAVPSAVSVGAPSPDCRDRDASRHSAGGQRGRSPHRSR